MFISTAHSFRQQARLAITLAWVAGYTNILSVLTCGHVTSHVSGTASEAGRFFVEGLWSAAGFALFLLTMFLIGAMIAGLATEVGRRRGWESIYVLPMGIEALLLSGFALFVEQHTAGQAAHGARLYAMTGLASMAMGLQNATVTHISGGAVRTTHVTGVLSDLGFELARFLLNIADVRRARLSDAARRLIALVREPEAHRLMLLASIMLSFAFGAALAALAYEHIPVFAMIPAVAFLLLMIAADLFQPIARITPANIEHVADLDPLGTLAAYKLNPDRSRPHGVQQVPNLVSWSQRLPAKARVIVLDVGDAHGLNMDSIDELQRAMASVSLTGRRLVISGLTHEQLAQLHRAGIDELLDPANVCPDFDLAVARGLGLVMEQQWRAMAPRE